jgi:hypothetical protein
MRRAHAGLWACALTALACGGSQTLDERIKSVSVVGTRVGSTLYSNGAFDLLVVPLDGHGGALLDDDRFKVSATASSPPGLRLTPVSTTCTRQRERLPLAMGIVVDDSSSMGTSDPNDASGPAPGRKAAVAKLIAAMVPGDETMLTDFFGTGSDPLRDLVCVAGGGSGAPACVASAASLTSDTAALQAAIPIITNHAGTPLYAACLEMAGILGSQPHDRRAMVVLSDGVPSDAAARATCLDAARSSNLRIFTVGFGGTSGASALRELSESTGGAYAAFNDAARLDELVSNLGYSDGYCTITLSMDSPGSLTPTAPVDAQVAVGTSGARASFGFLAPRTGP